jgi:cysteinyl-tRNA synthetase
MDLKLYDTLTREKRVFKPLDPKNVRMYVCGPTVYDFAHIGNARPVIVFDVLFRLLRHLYGADHVTYVRNITDVDDKINARAAEEYPALPLNEAIRKVTEATEAQFQADVNALGCLPPTHQPRATEFVLPRGDGRIDMKSLIQKLLDRRNAYVAEGTEGKEVLFDVSSMPDYGALSGRNLEDQKAGARIAVDAHKKNPGDFVLWKESGAREPGWKGEYEFVPDPRSGYDAEFTISRENALRLGRNSRIVTIHGRPGWHIECSAMSAAYLGEIFDIHGGGIDLVFPHHENEIAQSRCAFHTPVMANYWMHNGFLQVEGEKMSKSLGNFVTIRELLRDWPGEVLRLNMLRTHYRQPIDWTLQGIEESKKVLNGWYGLVGNTESSIETEIDGQVRAALLDDLNTPSALSRLHAIGHEIRVASGFREIELKRALKVSCSVLGLLNKTRRDYLESDPRMRVIDLNKVAALVGDRNAARLRKDFKESDRIRDELAKMGIVLKDTKDSQTGESKTTWEIVP